MLERQFLTTGSENSLGDIAMDEIVQRIQAAREQLALADVFDDFITGDIICGTGMMSF
jgi:hypothetical protein